ncbi:hypothetical protein GEMRC1_008642 [Eukaryota sp. GEM-RC1]
MIIGLLLLCCCVLGAVFKWDAASSGLWSEGNNWNPALTPSISSSVVLPARSTTLTVTVDVHITISSLTLSSNVVILFIDHSTLTITDTLLLNGGTLRSDISSSSSFTSVNSLVLDADLVSLFSHKLIVTSGFDWKRGSMDLSGDEESPVSSGVLHVWGRNNRGQLGGGLSGNQEFPESFSLPYPIKQASGGQTHSLVLLSNGYLYTSGRNNRGQLGYDGDNRNVHEKVQISTVIHVLASSWSSYALSSSGFVYSWGGNYNGELGLGHTNFIDTPTLILNLSNVKQIAGRYQTTFALTRDGKVYGWGWGHDNTLCRSSTVNQPSPLLMESLQDIKFIAAGRAAFFMKEDGSTVTCGLKLGESGTYSTPTQFAEDIEFTFIDTITHHALGIDVNQKLWSWGDGGNGRLGRGTSTASTTPVKVKNIGKVITATAGYVHSTAVDFINDVWSWGRNWDGSLGRTASQSSPSFFPGRITHLDGKGVTDISASWPSNFAYSSQSSVSLSYSTLYLNDISLNNVKYLEICDNSLVNLTQDSKIESHDLTITLNSSELYCDDSNDISISKLSLIVINSHFLNDFLVTNFHLLDLSFSTVASFDSEVIVGSLLCSHCQVLGNSLLTIDSHLEVNSGNFSTPLIVLESAENSLITGEVQFDNIIDFFSHVILDDVAFSASSLAIFSNAALLFKKNSTLTVTDTLLLNGGTFHTDLSSSSSFTSVNSLVLETDVVSLVSHKLIVTGLFNWKRGSIDLDGFSELVLDTVTLTLFSDGESSLNSDVLHVWGRNINGHLGGGLSGHQLLPESFNLPYPIRQTSVGNFHSLVVLINGDAYTAGTNTYGELGYDGDNRNVHEKIEVSDIIQVVASSVSSYALDSSGYVYSWGYNLHGELGLGHTENRATPTLIPNLNNVKQIAGRLHTAFALTRDGKVFGWGSGNRNILCSTDSVHSPFPIEPLENIKFIAAGRAAFFIKDDGSTLTCGRKLAESVTYATPIPFAEDIEFTFIDTHEYHALGIDVNQKLWSWGDGRNGRLGRGTTSSSTTPVEVKNIGKVITAAAGLRHSTAVDVNNDVWSWGDHWNGALGRSTYSNDERWAPGRITHLEGKGVTSISARQECNFAYSSHSSGISGQGILSLVNSNVKLSSYQFDIRKISLKFSTLKLSEISFYNLKNLELCGNSLVNLTQDSKIVSDNLTITLNSSKLDFDDSIEILSSTLSLIAINSSFLNDFVFDNIHILDLSFSTFESAASTQTFVAYFFCSHCQILGSSPLSVQKYAEINSGNFSSSLTVQESVDKSSITGRIQLANSFDFFSHVILDDVSVSEFQSSYGSITCHSDVLIKNDVAISEVSFIYHDTLTLYDSIFSF